MSSEFLQLDGSRIELKSETWDVSRLRLDVGNPRLYYDLKLKGIVKATDAAVEKLIYENEETKELMKSIQTTNGLIDPPWVMPDGVVKEGNRRTVAMRKLAAKDAARYSKVPVKVLPPDITDKQVRELLAIYHVVGKRPWKSAEQARTLWEMNEADGVPLQLLGEKLGMRPSTIRRRIEAFKAHQKFMEVAGDKAENVRKFSFFEEFEKQPYLRDQRDNDPSFLDEFIDWMLSGKLKDSRQCRDLPDILKNEDAAEVFEKKGFEAAKRVLAHDDPSVESKLYQRIDHAISVIDKMSSKDISELCSDNPKQEKFKQLVESILRVQDQSGVELVPVPA